MKIDNSTILMSGSHNLTAKYEKKEDLRMWVGSERPDFEGRKTSELNPAFLINISVPPPDTVSSAADYQEIDPDAVLSPKDKMNKMLIESMLKAITGKDIKITTAHIINPDSVTAKAAPTPQNSPAVEEMKGWGIEYDYHESYKETEQMSFNAEGIVKTIDGKDIQFTANLVMSREFMVQNNINIREGDAKKIDPLVINFNGTGAQLTDTKFEFDLNSDGEDENISFVRPGSGFLVLDKNNDGKINNGRELFGPATGSSFSELAGYDSDRNGWIDESDPIFNSLRIWSRDPSGKDVLSSLKDSKIGALYLGSMAVAFNIKDSSNQSHGEVKSTGVYLNESGSTGTMQQVDLTV